MDQKGVLLFLGLMAVAVLALVLLPRRQAAAIVPVGQVVPSHAYKNKQVWTIERNEKGRIAKFIIEVNAEES